MTPLTETSDHGPVGSVDVRLVDACADPLCRAWHALAQAQWRARFPVVAEALESALSRHPVPDGGHREAMVVVRATDLGGFPASTRGALSPYYTGSAGSDVACCRAMLEATGGGHADAPLPALCIALADVLRGTMTE